MFKRVQKMQIWEEWTWIFTIFFVFSLVVLVGVKIAVGLPEWILLSVGAIAAGLFISGCYLLDSVSQLCKSCKKNFGLDIPSRKDWKQEKFLSLHIPKKLRSLANAMDIAFAIENQVIEEFRMTKDVENVEQAKENLDQLAFVSKKAKKEFWAAHACAKALGYPVKKSYKDYLT